MNSIENLFLLMKERNITAKQLSDGTGISQGNISDWKSGKTKPKIEALLKLNCPTLCVQHKKAPMDN